MITDEQMDKKAQEYSLSAMTDDWMCDKHFSMGARWMRLMMLNEVSDILIDCYMQSQTCKDKKVPEKIVIGTEKMLDLFKRRGYEPELPF